MADEKEGVLRMLSSGRWAIIRSGYSPHEGTSGDVFRIEVGGKLVTTRMEFARTRFGGEYYSVDGHKLRSGMRPAIGVED